MFTWNVSEGKLMNEMKAKYFRGRFLAQDTTSVEDKIAFVDLMKSGKATTAIELIKKYKSDIESGVIKCDVSTFNGKPRPKTVSLKAWLKKNSNPTLCDSDYDYGKLRLTRGRAMYIQNMDNDVETKIKNLIDDMFGDVLFDCAREESEYYWAHDPLEIAKRKVKENPFTDYVCDLAYCSNGVICFSSDYDKFGWKDAPELSLEDCNRILEACDKIERYAKEVRQEFEAAKAEGV